MSEYHLNLAFCWGEGIIVNDSKLKTEQMVLSVISIGCLETANGAAENGEITQRSQ